MLNIYQPTRQKSERVPSTPEAKRSTVRIGLISNPHRDIDSPLQARRVDADSLVYLAVDLTNDAIGWALPLAIKLKLDVLGTWPEVETKIIEELDGILRRKDDKGQAVPLDMATIEQAHRWLITRFELPEHLVEPPNFALRIFHYFKAKNPPEASLLNSFFLGDLARATRLVANKSAPIGLRSYLGIDKPPQAFDLLNDMTALESAVAPARTPLARWPSPGGFPLVTLQQAAVNLARSETLNGEGLRWSVRHQNIWDI